MTEQVKLRLIGLAVIVVSAAVLFPLLFNGAGYQERHLTSAIPQPPVAPVIVDVQPAKSAIAPQLDIEKPVAAQRIPAAPVAAIVPPEPVQARPGLSLVMAEKIRRAREAGQPLPADAQQAQKSLQVADVPPVLDQQGVPVAWTLQLASFKDAANARGLRKKLAGAGYKVYTRERQGLVKVFVGPDIQRTNLERLKATLKKTMGMDGIIVRFTTR